MSRAAAVTMTTTMTDLVVISADIDRAGAGVDDDQRMVGRMLAEWRSAATRREYTRDIARFFASRGALVASDDPAVMLEQLVGAIREFCTLRTPEVAAALADWKLELRGEGLAPTTINRRLSAVRALLRLCRRYGWTEVDPAGLVDNELLGDLRRDVSGPIVHEVRKLIEAAAAKRPALVGMRDYAMLLFLWENIGRRAELCALSIEHYDEKRSLLTLTRKRGKVETVSITPRLRDAIDDWLEARTKGARLDNGEPIFTNLSRNRPGRLTGSGLYKILREYGAEVLGRPLSPHRMRHAGATAYAQKTGDAIALQRLGGWSRTDTAMRYVDKAANLQAKASAVLGKLA